MAKTTLNFMTQSPTIIQFYTATRHSGKKFRTADDPQVYLFKKFSGNPPRGQSIATNSPLPDSVM